MMTRKNLILIPKLLCAVAMFTLLTGARGCQTTAGSSSYTSYPAPPPTSGHVVGGPVDSGVPLPAPAPILYTGDLALTAYAPVMSSLSAETETFNAIVREGGAFGPVILEGGGFVFDAYGVGAVDLLELPYGFYDIELVGLDFFGNAASYAATSISIDEPLASLAMELESTSYAGDVVLELYAPDGGIYENPIDTVDYFLWEVDELTGELIFVEEMAELQYFDWDPPVIGALELGSYYIEVYAYDAYGYNIYEFGGDFDHDADLTYLPVDLWYTGG